MVSAIQLNKRDVDKHRLLHVILNEREESPFFINFFKKTIEKYFKLTYA